METLYFTRDFIDYRRLAGEIGLGDKVITGVRLGTSDIQSVYLELLSDPNKSGRFLNFSLMFANKAYMPKDKPVSIESAYTRTAGIEFPRDPYLLVAGALRLDEYSLWLEDAGEDVDPEKFTSVFFNAIKGEPEIPYRTPENDELRAIRKEKKGDPELSRCLIAKIIEFWAKDGFRKSGKKK